MMISFKSASKKIACALIICSMTPTMEGYAQGKLDRSKVVIGKRPLAVVFAADAAPSQSAINFYKAVYQSYSQHQSWDLLSFATMRQAMSASSSSSYGGLVTVDRTSFRKKLPRKINRKSGAKVITGSPVPDLQRLLDNLRAPAAIVVDCAKRDGIVLRGCALYFYDRVASRVTASVVKTFVSGATDATAWAQPLVQSLEDGIASAEREKDLEVIEELVARKENDEDDTVYGLLAIYGKGDRTQLSTGWRQTISGGGLQVGMLSDSVGAAAEYGLLTWSGEGELKSAKRTNYGLNMMFRAKAMESLLWFFEIGGGREINEFQGEKTEDKLKSTGVYAHITPGVGLELAEFFSLNLGVGWRWYFESSSTGEGALTTVNMSDSKIPSIALRATLLL
ncbi:MAG: hypothetical protein NT027_09480 [Proteobacteria bacterium]|nr:hypothetical protein [Pseudomonadota bacterium]